MTILVTGANGFVGRELCRQLGQVGVHARASLRTPADSASGVETVVTGDLSAHTDWTHALTGVDAVVHLAARVHVMHEGRHDPLAAFRRVNVDGTRQLAQQAVKAGVQRFVYASSIKVNGESTTGTPFRADDAPQPGDAYAQSKLEAELALQEIARGTGMEIVIVRPPLVYGPGVKGNFLSMMRVLQRGVPLPLASCANRRSFVGLTNLVDLLVQCVLHPAAANETFLAADGEDLSTPELLRRLARALGRKARLLPFPPTMLRVAASIAGRPGFYERLCGSLLVDASKTRELLGWRPPSTVDEELARTAHWFLASHP